MANRLGVFSNFKNLVTLVTGGASGLGLGTAKHLAGLGCKVISCDIKEVVDDLTTNNILFTKTDVTKSEDISDTLNLIKDKFGRLDVVVNCVGLAKPLSTISIQSLKPHSLDEFENMLRVNTLTTFNVCRLSTALMSENSPNEDGQRGLIINTSGSAAFEGNKNQSAYSASKAAIVAMTLPMARDLAPLGIRVMSISPGLFKTSVSGYTEEKGNAFLMEFFSQTCLALERFGEPEEFARLVETIIANPMLNGTTIKLDAGSRIVHL